MERQLFLAGCLLLVILSIIALVADLQSVDFDITSIDNGNIQGQLTLSGETKQTWNRQIEKLMSSEDPDRQLAEQLYFNRIIEEHLVRERDGLE